MRRSYARMSGDWNRVGHLLHIAPQRIDSNAEKILEECAQIYINAILELAATGHPNWQPLKPNTIAKKGGITAFYRWKGQFLEKIGVTRRVKAKMGHLKLFIGASPYRTHHSGLKMDELSIILEETHNRPLFGPAWERCKWEIEKKLAEIGNIF